jgi:hypothetical protein
MVLRAICGYQVRDTFYSVPEGPKMASMSEANPARRSPILVCICKKYARAEAWARIWRTLSSYIAGQLPKRSRAKKQLLGQSLVACRGQTSKSRSMTSRHALSPICKPNVVHVAHVVVPQPLITTLDKGSQSPVSGTPICSATYGERSETVESVCLSRIPVSKSRLAQI